MEEELSKIKLFSKEHSKEERQKTALKIKEKRGEYFEHKEGLEKQIDDLLSKTKEKEVNISQLTQEIGDLEKLIAQYKESKITKFLNYFEIKRKEKEPETKISARERLSQDFRSLKEILEGLQQDLKNKQKLAEAKEILKDFYQTQKEKWQEYEKEEKAKDVANIIEQYDVAVIHATNPYGVPGDNSLLRENIDWQTKLKILLALRPPISASTFKKGDGRYNMWAHLGVILKGGYVETAHHQDLGTKALSFQERRRLGASREGKVSEKIQEAILKRPSNDYNELVVRDPELAGFYLCLDDSKDIINLDEIEKITKELNLPIYILKGGEIFEARFDPEIEEKFNLEWEELLKQIRALGEEKEGYIYPRPEKAEEFQKLMQKREALQRKWHKERLQIKKSVEPEEILKNDFEIPQLQRHLIIEGLFQENCPFKPAFTEAHCIDSRAGGMQDYLEINAKKISEKLPSQEDFFKYEKGPREVGTLEESAEVQIISETKLASSLYEIQYLLTKDGRFFKRVYDKERGIISTTDLFAKSYYRPQKDGYINLGWRLESLGGTFWNDEDYLHGMERFIQKIKQEARYNEYLNHLAFHLYGFGEQAGQLGDLETQSKVYELAGRIFPQEQYRKIIQKRIDPQGNFKTYKEDFEK